MQHPSKISQNGPRNAPKATLGASWFEVAKKGAKASYKIQIIGATWPILADFWDPSKSGWAPKTAQQIQYGYFLVPLGDQRAEKIGFGRRLERA